jgi:hypothetical protein
MFFSSLRMKTGKVALAFIAIALLTTLAQGAKAQFVNAEDLFDAKAVAKRHRAELMKIAHVRVVTAEIDAQNDAAVLIEVDDQKNVDEVTRQLPSQIEGFPVEVGEDDSSEDGAVDEFRNDPDVTAMPTPVPPTVDQNGIYSQTWQPATTPDGSQ